MPYHQLPEVIEFTPNPSETHQSFARFLRERVGLSHITDADVNAFLKFHPLWQNSQERADERTAAAAAKEEAKEAEKAKRAEERAAKEAEREQKRQEREAAKAEKEAAKAAKDAASTGDDSDLDAVDAGDDDEAAPAPRARRRKAAAGESASEL
ncbi:hypothetical protein [Nocardia phage P3.1]|nr:hypothetical protein [Nocardia phage P3.1]